MKQDFWTSRWNEGRIGFHRTEPTPALVEFASVLPAPPGRVLVPMCGKATDLLWLAERGHRVLGVEFVREACEQFFDENGLAHEVHREGEFEVFRDSDGRIELRCGDVFDLDPGTLATVDGVYDRAGLVALAPETRAAYAALLAKGLAPGTPYLLVALEREREPDEGPPFNLPHSSLRGLFEPAFELEQLQRPEDQPRDERGFTEVAYSLKRA